MARTGTAREGDGGRPLVQVEGLHKSFDETPVLKGIDLAFAPHRTTVVLGPSGCGKSVLLKHLVGLLRPDQGEVRFDGERIDTLPEREFTRIRRQFGFLFQMGALFDSLKVSENIEFPLREAGIADPDERHERIREVLSMVGLEACMSMMPADLSGGQRKRIALARSIVLRPRVVLYDEPTTGLDPIRANVINDLIVRLQRDLNISSIVVTHDLDSTFQVGDRMVLLHHGVCHLEGTPEVFRTTDDPIARNFLEGRDSDGIDGATSRGTLATPGREATS